MTGCNSHNRTELLRHLRIRTDASRGVLFIQVADHVPFLDNYAD